MEVVREVPVQVPVEILEEVVREVLVAREVIREVPVEVVREVPVEHEIMREVPSTAKLCARWSATRRGSTRRRLEELETMQDQLASRAGRMPIDEKRLALLNMAGGVGHVFNNVLAGILDRTQLLVKRASREKSREIGSGLHEIEVATRTGIDTLGRIQEFSRSRPAEPSRSPPST